ncbi:MAG: phospholipase [Gammaproteobacteria bacterium]|nr:phospholipase [Gammaproteobacteria bacterium]
MNGQVRLLEGGELHQAVIHDGLLSAQQWVWIATADLKDMHVQIDRAFVPILEQFDRMAQRGVRFRIVHSALPSRPFRATLEGFKALTGGGLELQICPRCHWKLVLVDGRFAYCGSANFTGAGLGAKNIHKRNLELGLVTEDAAWVARLTAIFDRFWIGAHCQACKLRAACPDPIS